MTRPRGFSLLELAIVMVISGFLMVGIIRIFETLQMKRDFDVTRERMGKIEQQLDAFVDMNERLPCPLAPGDGAQAPEPQDCSKADLKPGERDVAVGILPLAALELGPQDAQDGWGHMFTYAVSARLTKANSMRGVTPPVGVIGLVNGYGDNVLETPDTGRYVVVSHGPRGAGGFTPQGREVPCEEGTLSAKNCHAPGVFVAAAWSTAHGPYFFDNLVEGDASRRQARLLAHLDACGRIGRYFAPERFFADKDGCVADDKVYGNCSIESSYMEHVGVYSPFTGDWDNPSQLNWKPARPGRGICGCEKGFVPMMAGSWQLPLHHYDPPLTMKDYCTMAVKHESNAIIKSDCSADPPSLDIRMRLWRYEYITFNTKVLKQMGSEWRADDGRTGSILKILALDPDTGERVWAKAAAHTKKEDINVIHITWTTPLVEKSHKLTVYTCKRM